MSMLYGTPIPDPMDTKTWFSDEQMLEAYGHSNFGTKDPAELRTILEKSVVKKLLKYHCGHTITQIMIEMKLITPKGTVTKLGLNVARASLHAHVVNV